MLDVTFFRIGNLGFGTMLIIFAVGYGLHRIYNFIDKKIGMR